MFPLLNRLCQALFIGGLLAGCNTTLVGKDLSTLPTADFPVPQDGDIFVYANGNFEVVTGSSTTSFESENKRGVEYVRSVNPLFNPLSWRNRARFGENIYPATEPGDTWPSTFSNTYRFVSSSTGAIREVESFWRCSTNEPVRATFLMGAYEVHEIECVQSSAVRQRPWRRVVSEYSPDLQRVLRVTRETYRTRRTRTTEMIAVVPSPSRFGPDKGEAVSRLIQEVLENDVSGTSRSIDGGSSGARFTVLGTTRGENGVFCRRYVLTLTAPSMRESFPGIRCRSDQGVWLVPGLG